jgi:DNA-binding response OmpR family regulator
MRILLVEAETSMQNLLCKALIREGFNVSTASSSQDAMERIAGEKFDIVIIDENTCRSGKIDITQMIHGLSSDTGVILISQLYGGEFFDQIGKNFDGHRILRCNGRPFRLSELKNLIRKIYARKV